MANFIDAIQNNKLGSNFELTYGEQVGAQQTSVQANNYANPYNTNFAFRDGQLLARLNQFDHNPFA